MRLLFANNVGLIARGLVIHQDAVADDVPALGRHAFIVVADRAQRHRFGLVGDEIDALGSELELLGPPLVESGKAGAGELAS